MIEDCKDRLSNSYGKQLTFVIVAPRILLAQQLCNDFISQITNSIKVLHVHSGKTKYDRTTKVAEITHWNSINPHHNKFIFTTYHSLHRIVDSMVDIDVL